MSFTLPSAKTYQQRAQECRELAKLAPPHLKDGYAQLAKAYEDLAQLASPKK